MADHAVVMLDGGEVGILGSYSRGSSLLILIRIPQASARSRRGIAFMVLGTESSKFPVYVLRRRNFVVLGKSVELRMRGP